MFSIINNFNNTDDQVRLRVRSSVHVWTGLSSQGRSASELQKKVLKKKTNHVFLLKSFYFIYEKKFKELI